MAATHAPQAQVAPHQSGQPPQVQPPAQAPPVHQPPRQVTFEDNDELDVPDFLK
jgi:cell division protein FtsZ